MTMKTNNKTMPAARPWPENYNRRVVFSVWSAKQQATAKRNGIFCTICAKL
jgi:hypothetical protein